MSATPTGPENREIQALLRDAGLDGDADLAAALGGMRALALDTPPAPRADLAALLAPGVSSLDARRNRQRRMGAVIGAVVVGTMGLGAGAVAASSEDFRRSVGHTVEKIFTPAPQAPVTGTDTASTAPSNVPAMTAVPPAPSGGTAPATPAPDSPTAVPAAPSTGADPARRAPKPVEKPDKAPAAPAVRPSELPSVPAVGKAPELPVKPSAPPSVLPGIPGSASDQGRDKS